LAAVFFSAIVLVRIKAIQQSVHPTLGILAKISSSFLRFIIFPVGRLRRPPPQRG